MAVMHSRGDLSEEVSGLVLRKSLFVLNVFIQLSSARILHHHHYPLSALKHWTHNTFHSYFALLMAELATHLCCVLPSYRRMIFGCTREAVISISLWMWALSRSFLSLSFLMDLIATWSTQYKQHIIESYGVITLLKVDMKNTTMLKIWNLRVQKHFFAVKS